MSVDVLPELNPPDFGRVADARRPILSFGWHLPTAHRASAHRHPRAHIIHPIAGAYRAVTPDGTWLVPAGQALWIPPDVFHEVYSQGPVEARMIFVDRELCAGLPTRCGTVEVSPLLAALLERALQLGNDYAVDSPASRLALVLLDELAQMAPTPFILPMGRDPRLVRALERVAADPAAATGLAAVAKAAGASSRTLARLFRSETGMTFTEWRTRLLLIEAVERLARGASVTEVALELGYGSTSSFVFMFRQQVGVSPGQWRDGRAP
jgi:AraC-like DNA-binding protein